MLHGDRIEDEVDMKESAVVVHDLTVAYDRKPVLLDIDLSLPAGSLNGVIGPNGAGKTTLLRAMLGLIRPATGDVHFPVLGYDRLPKKTNKIAYVPQSGTVDWDFPATVMDIVLMGRYGHLGWFKRPTREDRSIAREALERMEMLPYAGRNIRELSGGQQQRVFLARALAQRAELYFMDEPFKGVDVRTQSAIVALMREIRASGGTVVTVHHDLDTVTEYFDWVTVIRRQVIANGPPETAFTDENLRLAYGDGLKSVRRPSASDRGDVTSSGASSRGASCEASFCNASSCGDASRGGASCDDASRGGTSCGDASCDDACRYEDRTVS